jgi:glycosyltransferase involved in cell wall biosynthesis
MRIGLLIYNSPNTLSGSSFYNQKLVAHLREQGHRVDLITLPQRNYWRHLTDNGRYRLMRWLAEFQLDLMVQDALSHPSLVWLNKPLRTSVSYPIVSLVHRLKVTDSAPRLSKLFYGRIERSYLHSLDGMIFTSQTTRRTVADMFNGLPPHVVALPGGDHFGKSAVSIRELTARAHDGDLRLLYVGNIMPRKGLHTVIEAVAHHPASQLWVVGDATVDVGYTQKIYRMVEDLGLFGRIHFLPPLEDAALADQYRQAHLLVIPSRHESLGNVYTVGMGFGLPAIGTTRSAAHELISHEENGFLIPVDDAEMLTSYLHQVDGDRELLTAMSTAALTRFRQHPTWSDSMTRVQEFLEGF